MPVDVAMRGRRVPALAARVRRQGARLLAALGLAEAELSVLLVSDGEMRRLNHDYRGFDRPTDVLSFPQREGPGPAPEQLLGDVVISVDTARRQAARWHASLGREADRLLIHGLLHLLGYDHERSPVEARRMQRRERLLARRLAR
jgi:rRNA maturation RNase YbeY